MNPTSVFLVVYSLVWGGLLAALLGWLVFNVILEALASVWPSRFPKTALRVRRRLRRKVRRRQRQLGKAYFNSTHGPEFSQACRDTIHLILSGGPDYFRKNGLRSPRADRRRKRYR